MVGSVEDRVEAVAGRERKACREGRAAVGAGAEGGDDLYLGREVEEAAGVGGHRHPEADEAEAKLLHGCGASPGHDPRPKLWPAPPTLAGAAGDEKDFTNA